MIRERTIQKLLVDKLNKQQCFHELHRSDLKLVLVQHGEEHHCLL